MIAARRRGRGLVLPGKVLARALGCCVLVLTAGCSMFHSNVRGGFLCSAPNGSCAPTSLIDDGAIRDIRGREKTDHGGDLVLPPIDPASPKPADVIFPSERQARDPRGLAAVSGRALKVTYPAHLDGDGKVVPKRIAYALVDLPEWQALRGESLVTADGRVTQGVSRGLLGAAQSAPDALGMTEPARRAASSVAPAVQSDATSIDAIKAQAQQVLNAAKTRNAGTFSPPGN